MDSLELLHVFDILDLVFNEYFEPPDCILDTAIPLTKNKFELCMCCLIDAGCCMTIVAVLASPCCDELLLMLDSIFVDVLYDLMTLVLVDVDC